ncbi:MAG: hypothetical protein ACI8YQ_001629 [Polaribacter sp.]|jgi:hypothetical protein
MNKIIWFFIVALLLSVMASCGKGEATEPEELSNSSFSCKIDGQFWETKTVSREVMIRSEELPGVFFKTLIISGISEGEELITLHIYNMYDAESGDCPGVYTYYGSGHEDYEEKALQTVVDGTRYGDHSAISYFSSVENSSGSGFGDIVTTVASCENFKVSGTFQGTIYAQSADGSFELNVTEGKFENVPYVIEE